jgi:hypothetical protein
MNIDDKLNLLKQIKEVDAPPFLLTRIRQRVQDLDNAETPLKWKWAFALASVVVLALNISILFTSSSSVIKKNAGVENMVNAMNLSDKNDLYNE